MGELVPFPGSSSALEGLLALLASELRVYQEDLARPGLNSLQLTIHYNPRTGRPATVLYRPEFRREMAPRARMVGE